MLGVVDVGNAKKKLYSIFTFLSCLNLGASGYSNIANESLLLNDLHDESKDDNNNIKDNLEIGNLENKIRTNESGSLSSDSLDVGDSYQLNLKKQEEWNKRFEQGNPNGIDSKSRPLSRDRDTKSDDKLPSFLTNFVVPGLAVVGAGTTISNIYPGIKFLLSYRYKSDIRNFRALLESAQNPGITDEYQCIMANASIPDSIIVSNDSIPRLNKNQVMESKPLYKSTQIFKDDGKQKRSITFGENIKTPDSFLIQKSQGKLVLEFSKQHLDNDLKVYVQAKELDLKLNDVSILNEDSNWGVSIYKADKLTLFLNVPKDKIRKL